MSEVNGRQWLQLGGWVGGRLATVGGWADCEKRLVGVNEGVCKDFFQGQEDRSWSLCASAGRGENNIMCCCLLLTTSSTVIAFL